MAESLKNDDKSIRSYILNDVHEKVPIDKSYENLCKLIGNDAIAFYDFQFWYYRFLSGKQDLDFDRSSDPEPLQFSDLPVDAVGLIVNKLEIVERLMLRRVSRALREFMEKQEFDCNCIEVTFNDGHIDMTYGIGEEYGEDDVYGDDCVSVVCNDLACVLKNPKLQLRIFDFWPNQGYEAEVLSTFYTKFECVLRSLNHQIAVRELVLRPERPDNFLAILPYLKPGYLEDITIYYTIGSYDWKSDESIRKMEQILQLDQWKQANHLCLHDSLDLFPDEVFLQFKTYWFDSSTFNRSQLDRIRMKFAASPVFEYCHVSTQDPSDDGNFIDFIGVPGPIIGYYRSVRHYMIPNTDKLLVFTEHLDGDIEIQKKTRADVE
ncbi:unnamed protein product [Caenorhabditis brenneri]